MNIEIIGGDPAAQKALQARLDYAGFTATISKPMQATQSPQAGERTQIKFTQEQFDFGLRDILIRLAGCREEIETENPDTREAAAQIVDKRIAIITHPIAHDFN